MQLFKLMATLGLDSKEYEKGLDQAEKSAGKMGGAMSKLGSTIKALAIPAALGAIGKKSIDVGMDFEAAMSQVAATMGMTAEEIRNGSADFELLEKAAKKAGAETQFSASESAEALNYLALAGYNAKEAAETLPTVLNLAAAGGMDLAYASDLVTDSMSALGLPLEEVNTFTDKLAKTSQKSNTNVSQLGEAILRVGGTAKVLKGGVTEMNTVLGILADNGIKGAEGGTALRNIILAMTPTTDKAVAAFKRLNLETYDADGNLRPLNEIFAEMNTKLSDLSQEERTEVLTNIFNKVDLKSANALLANSGERFNELAGYIDDSNGAAKTMAETMNANLKGAITSFKSALEGVGIAIYEKFSGALTGSVEKIVLFTRELGKIITESKTVGEALGRLGGLISQAAGEMFTAGANMITNLVNGLYTGTYLLPEKATEMMESFKNRLFWYLPEMLEKGVEFVNNIVTGIISSIPNIVQGAVNLVTGFVQTILENIPSVIDAGLQIMDNLVSELMRNLPKVVDSAIGMVQTLIQTLVDNLPKIAESAIKIVNKLCDTIKENLPTIIDAGFKMLMSIVDAIIKALPTLLNTAIKLVIDFAGTILRNLPTIFNAGIQILMKVVEGILSLFFKLPELALKLVVELVSGIISNLPKLVQAGKDMVKGVLDGLASLPGKVLELGKKIPSMLWDGIKSMTGWLGSKVSGFIDNIIGGRSLSLDVNAQPTPAMNGYSMVAAGNGARMSRLSNSMSSNMNVSLNIGGREFDRLVIKTVTDNYGKIENIIQSKERGRR